jgi:hypothetical protein
VRGCSRQTAKASAFTAALVAVAVTGCAQATTGTTVSTIPVMRALAATTSAHRHHHEASPSARRAAWRSTARRALGSGGLAYSTASSHVVQTQPARGSCHAIGTGLYSRPDPRCTPGALNPAVTQNTIGRTICAAGWAATVRPPENVSEAEKQASMAAYGDTGALSLYEYDHFVPLELGGAVNDRRNLWPEPGASPNPKDDVEDELNRKVCDREMTLAQAQHAITANWTSLAASASGPSPSTSATGGGTATDGAGGSASWHTDASGYADVYFHASTSGAGETVTAHVGVATCSTTL